MRLAKHGSIKMAIKMSEIFYIVLFSFMVFSCSIKEKEQYLPNIILVMADDLSYGDVGCYGSLAVKTPHLDEMANAGIRFEQFYAAAPVC